MAEPFVSAAEKPVQITLTASALITEILINPFAAAHRRKTSRIAGTSKARSTRRNKTSAEKTNPLLLRRRYHLFHALERLVVLAKLFQHLPRWPQLVKQLRGERLRIRF